MINTMRLVFRYLQGWCKFKIYDIWVFLYIYISSLKLTASSPLKIGLSTQKGAGSSPKQCHVFKGELAFSFREAESGDELKHLNCCTIRVWQQVKDWKLAAGSPKRNPESSMDVKLLFFLGFECNSVNPSLILDVLILGFFCKILVSYEINHCYTLAILYSLSTTRLSWFLRHSFLFETFVFWF